MPDTEVPASSGLPTEISNSLAMVWKRYAGRRPTDIETVVNGTRICCVLKDSVQSFDEGMAAPEVGDDGERLPARKISSYEHDAIEAVTKVVRQRVVAFVSKHDTETDTAREVFILDRPARRRPSIFLDRRPA